jgi:hypothetical protein
MTISVDLNPGVRNLRYGAAVLLSPAETSSGEIVLQKGYSTADGQYNCRSTASPASRPA